MDLWLGAMELTNALESSDGGTDLYVSGPNPGGIFLGPADSLHFHVSTERISSITIHQLPFARTMAEELEDLTRLLGPPDHIIAQELQDDYPPPMVDITLVYLNEGTVLQYLAHLTQVSLDGKLEDAICLAESPRRDATLFITTDLTFMSGDRFDWGRRMHMPEAALLDELIMGEGCAPLYP